MESSSPTPRPRKASPSFGQLFPQLFLFPLLIVVVCVLVYLFFVASGRDHRTIDQLLSDIERGSDHARGQDAYALALLVQDLEPGQFLSREATERLLRLHERFRTERDFAKYIALTLGRAGQPELALPVMREIALAEDTDPEGRLTAVTALGLTSTTGVAESAAVLTQLAREYQRDDQWEIRWRALGGLANLRAEAAVELLRGALGDPRREIRWSAACWLANVFRDPAGIDVLEQLVSWEFLSEQRGDRDRELHFSEKEGYMIQALRGLAELRGAASHALLRELQSESPSFKVRDAASRILEAAAAGAPTGGAGPEERGGVPPAEDSGGGSPKDTNSTVNGTGSDEQRDAPPDDETAVENEASRARSGDRSRPRGRSLIAMRRTRSNEFPTRMDLRTAVGASKGVPL